MRTLSGGDDGTRYCIPKQTCRYRGNPSVARVPDAGGAVARTVSATRTHVAIAANESVSTYLLPQALSSVRKRWPQTRFTVSIASNANVREHVVRDGLDMGLLLERAHRCGTGDRFARDVASARNRIVVKDIRLAVFASASHPLRGHPFARSSMAPYPLFVSAAALEFRDFMHRYTGKHRSQCMTSSNDPRATTTMSGRYGCLSLERARRNSARALEQSSF